MYSKQGNTILTQLIPYIISTCLSLKIIPTRAQPKTCYKLTNNKKMKWLIALQKEINLKYLRGTTQNKVKYYQRVTSLLKASTLIKEETSLLRFSFI